MFALENGTSRRANRWEGEYFPRTMGPIQISTLKGEERIRRWKFCLLSSAVEDSGATAERGSHGRLSGRICVGSPGDAHVGLRLCLE